MLYCCYCFPCCPVSHLLYTSYLLPRPPFCNRPMPSLFYSRDHIDIQPRKRSTKSKPGTYIDDIASLSSRAAHNNRHSKMMIQTWRVIVAVLPVVTVSSAVADTPRHDAKGELDFFCMASYWPYYALLDILVAYYVPRCLCPGGRAGAVDRTLSG